MRVGQIREDLAFGDVDQRQAQMRMAPAAGVRVTVRDVWERYVRGIPKRSAPHAERDWRKRLGPWFDGLLAFELDEATMRRWRVELEKIYSPKTIRDTWDRIQAAMRLAADDGVIARVPWGRYKVPAVHGPQQPRDALRNFEELIAFLDAARALDVDAAARGHLGDRLVICSVLALTGLRQAEAAGLAWRALELDATPHMLHVRYQAPRGWPRLTTSPWPDLPPKTKPLSQLLHPSAVAALRAQRTKLERLGWYHDKGPVFPNPRTGAWRTAGRVIRPESVRQIVARAGFKNPEAWVPHCLRHSFATLELVAHGGDLKAVQARTGHADVAVLEGYLHQAGRGIAPSRLPELPLAVQSPAPLEPPPLNDVALRSGEVSAFTAGFERAKQVQALRDLPALKRRDARKLAERPFAELAGEWILAGRPGARPAPVGDAAQRAYTRAYQREKYAGNGPEAARSAGRRARKATLAAWAKALLATERANGV